MNETIKSDYYKRIEIAIKFIEDNLKNKLSLDLVAEQACFSKYHFIRVFTAMTGETVGSYARRRRVTRSSKELITSDKSILAIAIDYQFESQEAYTRSFKRIYHTTPSMYRKHGLNQIAYGRSRLTVSRLLHLQNNITMKPKIVEIHRKTLVGMNTMTSLADNRIPQLWENFMARAHEIQENKKTGYYEVHPYDGNFKMEDYTETMEFEKWATVEVDTIRDVPENMKAHLLTGGKYAMFVHKGSMSNVQLSFDYIYGTWLPNSGYEFDLRDDFERYDPQKYFGPGHPDSEMEIYVPIK